MALFSYRCQRVDAREHHDDPDGDDGHVVVFDLTFPIGQAPNSTECPSCGSDAVRVFTPPRLSLVHRGALAALDRAERSRSEPDVVSALPAGPGRRRAAPPRASDPRLRALPRP